MKSVLSTLLIIPFGLIAMTIYTMIIVDPMIGFAIIISGVLILAFIGIHYAVEADVEERILEPQMRKKREMKRAKMADSINVLMLPILLCGISLGVVLCVPTDLIVQLFFGAIIVGAGIFYTVDSLNRISAKYNKW